MSSPTPFLTRNNIDERWKVLGKNNQVLGDGATTIEAIQSARVVTDEDIHFGDGMAYVNEPEEDLIKEDWELIDELARLANMKITYIYDNNDRFKGYRMELIE